MKKNIPLYQMLYHKMENRMLTGFYKKGDRLPSAQKLREQFDLGFNCVRRALRLLQEAGYIYIEERKSPVVVFDPETPACRQQRWEAFLCRKTAHLDAYRAFMFFAPGMAAQGAAQCAPAAWAELKDLVVSRISGAHTRSDLLELLHEFCAFLIRQAGNPLADDLFYQIRGFDELRRLVLPSAVLVPGEAEAAQVFLEHLLAKLRTGDTEDVRCLLEVCYRQVPCELAQCFARLAPQECTTRKQVAFSWYVYQRQLPLYQQIAVDLLRQARRELSQGDFFPSESALMEQYEVSAVTVRSALALLGSLGCAHTINGRGTQFLLSESHGEQRQSFLQEYFYSLQILTAGGFAIAQAAAPFLAPHAKTLLAEVPAFLYNNGLLVWLLEQMVNKLPLPALQNILYQLIDRLIFGLFIGQADSPAQLQYFEHSCKLTEDCLLRLAQGDEDGFSRQFALICESTHQASLTLQLAQNEPPYMR